MSTRPVTGIDQNVKLNRALWMLADAMRTDEGVSTGTGRQPIAALTDVITS
jgi:hypothetical protein